MAKVQGKKAAAKGRKVSPKKASASAARPKAKKAAPKKAAPKKAAPKKAVLKKAAPKAARPKAKAVKAVKKAVAKAATKIKPKAKAVAKAVVAKAAAARPAAKPAAAKSAAAPARAPHPPARAAEDKRRSRRARPRIQSNGTPVANWFTQGEKPRPSSFIPAPPRAEAPSLIAAPPASSDRLIRPEDVADLAVRIVPVRVDVEQSGGRVLLAINPDEVVLRVGEGIEWDFRYFGGADVTVEELVVEFEKPSPFSHAAFRSRKPGTARPHRQLSGAAQKSAAGKRAQYVIRAMTPFKTELAVAKPWVNVQA
jgi:hypothetical protein